MKCGEVTRTLMGELKRSVKSVHANSLSASSVSGDESTLLLPAQRGPPPWTSGR